MTCPFASKEIVSVHVSPLPPPPGKLTVRVHWCCPGHSPDAAWEDWAMNERDAVAWARDIIRQVESRS